MFPPDICSAMDTLLDSTEASSAQATTGFSAETSTAALHTQTGKFDTFVLFPQLPVELRLKIWRLSLPGPRVVLLKQDSFPPTKSFSSPAEIPVALAVCRESRQEALIFYEFAFGVHSLPGEICFDFSIDSILLDCEIVDYEDFLFLEIAESFRKLRSFICCYKYSALFGENAVDAAPLLPSLETLACLNNHVCDYDQRNLIFKDTPAIDELEGGEVTGIQNVLGVTFTYGEIGDHNPAPYNALED
jgi:hypothetical protein